ncbi:TIGR03086 family metal-binding protein [Streptacidiphilus sp. EB129]|uniref:TIGR03086 family metal-binding protein n=1 Tax=Streptacidiphilus sp. EB129 TaxID=3156262 RepID=UPI003516F1DE
MNATIAADQAPAVAAFDPRPLFLLALEQWEQVVTGYAPAQLDLPTPCDEFDLRALVGHTVGAVHRIAYIGEGGRGMDLPAAVGEIDDADWVGAVSRARARATSAWAAEEKLDRVVEVPWGTVPGRIALGGYLMELSTHTWDIAQVVDPAAELDQELGAVALGIAQQVLPADGRGGDLPFGAVQPAPADADTYTRLAAWLGRTV